MSSLLRFAPLLGALLGVAACSSSSSHSNLAKVDAKSYCELAVTQCGVQSGTESDCESQVSALLVSPACQTGLDKATCDDLNDNTSLEDTCFPKCTNAGVKHCNGSYLTECDDDSRTVNIDCAGACATASLTFTGTCGTSYQGQTSDED